MTCKFFEMIDKRWAAGARVCVGLDPDWEKVPERYRSQGTYSALVNFNYARVDETHHVALAYKPNLGFYLAKGVAGLSALVDTCGFIRSIAPDVPVILDGKFNDIGNTAKGYARFAFEECKADAVTVNPYLGGEACTPFIDYADKGVIVLCRTSNKGAGEFQDLQTFKTGEPWSNARPYYQVVADRVANSWNDNGNCALVVGATYPAELGEVRRIVGDMSILVPGIGTQGGDIDQMVHYGLNSKGSGIIPNSGSAVIFADNPERALIGTTASIQRAIEQRKTT